MHQLQKIRIKQQQSCDSIIENSNDKTALSKLRIQEQKSLFSIATTRSSEGRNWVFRGQSIFQANSARKAYQKPTPSSRKEAKGATLTTGKKMHVPNFMKPTKS